MAGISQAISKGFTDYKQYILRTTEKELRQWCWELLNAAIQWREKNTRAHNFTGNLLNSITVCLYRRNSPVIAYYSSSLVPEAIRPKMSAPKRSYFKRDYEGARSVYKPEVVTNRGWGKDDAEAFFESYSPRGNNLFDIVVAYTTEYAGFIEYERQTTGALQTWQQARNTGINFMELC